MISELMKYRGFFGGSGGGSSAPSDWNASEGEPGHILNKPFGETVVGGDTLTWDGSTDGKLIVADMLVKVSDAVATADDLTNGCTVTGVGTAKEFTPDDYFVFGDVFTVSDAAIFALKDNAEFNGIVLPEKGMYVALETQALAPVSITIPGYTGFMTTTVKTIDGKYLPEGLPYVEREVKAILTDAKPTLVSDSQYSLPDVIPFVVGSEYTVKWNGTEYKLVCGVTEAYNVTLQAVGNPVAFGGEDNGTPFFIASAPELPGLTGIGALIVDLTQSGQEITLSITGPVETVHKLDNKFLQTKPVIVKYMNTISPNSEVGDDLTNYDELAKALYYGNPVQLETEDGVRYFPVSWWFTGGLHVVFYVRKSADEYGPCYMHFIAGSWTPPEE